MYLNIHLAGNISGIIEGVSILSHRLKINLSDDGIIVNVIPDSDMLEIGTSDNGYYISYSDRAEFFRGLALLVDSIRNGTDPFMTEKKQFKTSGTMFDVSRGYVLKLDTVKDFLERISLMGMNMFMLYTEDTYHMDKYPWFGYLRGAYTIEEMRELDDYAYALGIEMIPCIQTLGHMATHLRWPSAYKYKDTSNCLLVGSDDTYELIDEMFKTMRSSFRSKRINIGLDEAVDLGNGQYEEINGKKSHADIIIEHLRKVSKIAKKYDFHPMMWSDMMFRLSGQPGEYDLAARIPDDIPRRLPKDIEMIYWDYCMEDEVLTDTILKVHNDIKRPTVFAGGIWTWNRLTTCYKKSFETSRRQLSACRDNGVSTVFTTIWASSKPYFSIYSVLPALQMWAELSYNPDASPEHIAKRFKSCTGYDFDTWQLLYPDEFTDEELSSLKDINCICVNSSIQHFFNDVLLGLMDKTLSGYDFKSKYLNLKNGIADIEIPDDMQDMFNRTAVLYNILYIKCDVGIRLRNAYKSKDIETLKLISQELSELEELYRQYHDLVSKMWFEECKPFTYNSLDAQLGGIESRIHTAKMRVDGYISGKYQSIDELESEIYYYNEVDKPLMEVNTPDTFTTVM